MMKDKTEMIRPSTWLLDHQRNVYSQTGEDGVVEKILETLPQTDKWCVEFGAWDGLYLSNTRNLIETKGYSAVLIEADKNKFRDLQHNYSQRSDVITINQFVGFTEEGNLDQIMTPIPIPFDFDLLSIDIDGNDYHVWKAISKYRPKVIVIEFNPTIPTHVRFVQPADPSINQGTSLLSLVGLGKEKGYELISVVGSNAFFIKQEYYQTFHIESNAPEVLWTNLEAITYLFSGYDGRIFLYGNCMLPWHGIELKESKVQHLPTILRTYPSNYTNLQKKDFRLYKNLVIDPSEGIKKIRRLIHRLTKRFT